MMIIKVVKAGTERPPRCLMDGEEFQAWKEPKEREI
jgi:hypothetical protein